MPVVLSSRWGLDPVVVATNDEVLFASKKAREDASTSAQVASAATASHEAEATALAAAGTAAAESSTVSWFSRLGGPDGDGGGKDDDDELTGRTLWDCTKVLYDLVSDPRQDNTFAVRGKV